MPPVVQLIPRTACRFFFSLPGLRPVLSALMSLLPKVAVSIWLWPWHIRFSLLSLSLYFPPGSLTSLYFSLTPLPPLFNLFLFHPNLFCPSAPLAKPSSPSLNFCSTPRGTAAEQTAVPYQTLSDIWKNAECQSRVTSPQQQSANDA